MGFYVQLVSPKLNPMSKHTTPETIRANPGELKSFACSARVQSQLEFRFGKKNRMEIRKPRVVASSFIELYSKT